MAIMGRRGAINQLLSAGAFGLTASLWGNGAYQTEDEEISEVERAAMGSVATDFMKEFGVPGLSVAISHKGRFVYREGFGDAYRELGERVSVASLFRIASVSKPITSVAIFTLIEEGRLLLEDRVFGKKGILGTQFGKQPYGKYIEDITIDHLLTHTAGGWEKGENDPMFTDPARDQADLISWTLDNRPLNNVPGEHYGYSNFGYCLLGRVIEKITKHSYRDYVQSGILSRCAISDMKISGNTFRQRAKEEVTYYGQSAENPYGMNVSRMDSHGGWIASASDLVKFATRVDGFTSTESILKPETIAKMTSASAVNGHYARGWQVNALGNWWHNGSLPGSSTILVRTSKNFCWAALTNTRTVPSGGIDDALDKMVWNMARRVTAWKL
jgi:CubicO group peptidase (beta-lactamase class C family)